MQELIGRIGIISPYKSQVRLLKDVVYNKLRDIGVPYNSIEINTVDAYQGREKDIIIISCVRGSQGKGLGFLNDYRRMNVAITRAKHFLWVVGNQKTLNKNQHWAKFIDYSKKLDKSFYQVFDKEQINGKDNTLMSYLQSFDPNN